ncbi:MAG: indole-3-glycerol phosphate synthase TrpC [Syntrophomonadaceae bacterium]|nr:indole-3-glycerol phosphate synthase TrpC [Syntrophomonadaceae bacterium]
MGFLQQVIEDKREQLARIKSELPLERLQQRAREGRRRPEVGFGESLGAPGISAIAEIKRASPSRGMIAPGLEAGKLASAFERAGARAVSVLTEEKYFHGSRRDLQQARASTRLPLLGKDFVIDPYQVWLAAADGASAVLLIAGLLGPALGELLEVCREAAVEALVEVHDRREVELAVKAGARIIGVNCRDLDTLEVRPELHTRLRPLLPPGVLTVAESGIKSREQVRRLEMLGYHAFLVGESLAGSPDPARRLRELLGREG